MEKTVGSDWTWLTDYVYAYATWTLNAEPGRRCEVGMGVKAFGGPRGQRKTFTDHVQFVTVGLGAIHVRTRDGGPPCTVRLDQGDVGPIQVTHKY
jgi:hypothetical protein